MSDQPEPERSTPVTPYPPAPPKIEDGKLTRDVHAK